MFDAFLAIYRNRTRDLLRIATGGTGVLPMGDIHPDLVVRLADEASKTARHLLLMCIRAIDYCPPADMELGEYLRALLTADTEVEKSDKWGFRESLMRSFRRRSICPDHV